jgi:hypothetical protein
MQFLVVPQVLITQYFIFLGLIMFKVRDWNDLIYCLDKFIFLDFLPLLQYQSLVYELIKETSLFLILDELYAILIIVFNANF